MTYMCVSLLEKAAFEKYINYYYYYYSQSIDSFR